MLYKTKQNTKAGFCRLLSSEAVVSCVLSTGLSHEVLVLFSPCPSIHFTQDVEGLLPDSVLLLCLHLDLKYLLLLRPQFAIFY